jgi:hypothetical protein
MEFDTIVMSPTGKVFNLLRASFVQFSSSLEHIVVLASSATYISEKGLRNNEYIF